MNQTISYTQIVNELKNYIENNQTFAFQVNQTFMEANPSNPATYNDMYEFWDFWITNAPLYNDSFLHTIGHFGTTVTGNEILETQIAERWVARWQNERKHYCDSSNSTWIIPEWEAWNEINMTEYIIPQNGFQSFNQFFSRHIKKQYRPISSPNDTNIITSPCDGGVVITHLNNLTNNTLFLLKGETYNLCEMLNYNYNKCELYENGSSIQIYLDTFNYHRFHSVSDGIIDSIEYIAGYEFLWPSNNDPALRSNADSIFQANHNQRGIMYLNNDKLKLIAHVFVGVDIVSSVNIEVDVGLPITKGDDVGCFKYGGSTIVVLFQHNVIQRIDLEVNEPVNMGQAVAFAN